MDILLKHESDSDVEVLEPEVLKDQYRALKLQLIKALSKCSCPIPKKWEDFQMFIKNVLKFQLSADLMHSTWVELCTAEQFINTKKNCDIVDISNDTEDETDKQARDKLQKSAHQLYSEHCSHKSKVPNGCAVLGGRVNQLEAVAQQADNIIVLSDEEEDCKLLPTQPVDRKLAEINNPMKSSEREDVSNKLDEYNTSLPLKRKQTNSKMRRSLPASLDEHQAETLREQLLLDKIIELELPQVIRGFLKNNNSLTNGIKRRKKNCLEKEVESGVVSDNSSGSRAFS